MKDETSDSDEDRARTDPGADDGGVIADRMPPAPGTEALPLEAEIDDNYVVAVPRGFAHRLSQASLPRDADES